MIQKDDFEMVFKASSAAMMHIFGWLLTLLALGALLMLGGFKLFGVGMILFIGRMFAQEGKRRIRMYQAVLDDVRKRMRRP